MFLLGTFETCRWTARMSVHQVKPEALDGVKLMRRPICDIANIPDAARPVFRTKLSLGLARRSGAIEQALHKDKIEPAIELAANLAEMCNLLETKPPMQG
jgi:hypothetical protein